MKNIIVVLVYCFYLGKDKRKRLFFSFYFLGICLAFAQIDEIPCFGYFFHLQFIKFVFGQTELTIRLCLYISEWAIRKQMHSEIINGCCCCVHPQQRFFLCALLSFRFLRIISCNASKPSCNPSPVIAQAGCINQPLNDAAAAVVFDVLDEDVDDIVDEAWWGDAELDVDIDVCGGGVLEQFDDTSVLLLSRLFRRVSTGLWPVLIFADTGNVDCDFIICGEIAENDNSCRPSNFSNSFGSLAPGKSCLLANIKMGTPCNKQ